MSCLQRNGYGDVPNEVSLKEGPTICSTDTSVLDSTCLGNDKEENDGEDHISKSPTAGDADDGDDSDVESDCASIHCPSKSEYEVCILDTCGFVRVTSGVRVAQLVKAEARNQKDLGMKSVRIVLERIDATDYMIPVGALARGYSSCPPKKRRRVKCGECSGCTAVFDCRECIFCKDKKKYGGAGRAKRACIHRTCVRMLSGNTEKFGIMLRKEECVDDANIPATVDDPPATVNDPPATVNDVDGKPSVVTLMLKNCNRKIPPLPLPPISEFSNPPPEMHKKSKFIAEQEKFSMCIAHNENKNPELASAAQTKPEGYSGTAGNWPILQTNQGNSLGVTTTMLPPTFKTVRLRRRRCGACENCANHVDCGECMFCKDMRKFGGKGSLKKACSKRKCLLLVDVFRRKDSNLSGYFVSTNNRQLGNLAGDPPPPPLKPPSPTPQSKQGAALVRRSPNISADSLSNSRLLTEEILKPTLKEDAICLDRTDRSIASLDQVQSAPVVGIVNNNSYPIGGSNNSLPLIGGGNSNLPLIGGPARDTSARFCEKPFLKPPRKNKAKLIFLCIWEAVEDYNDTERVFGGYVLAATKEDYLYTSATRMSVQYVVTHINGVRLKLPLVYCRLSDMSLFQNMTAKKVHAKISSNYDDALSRKSAEGDNRSSLTFHLLKTTGAKTVYMASAETSHPNFAVTFANDGPSMFTLTNFINKDSTVCEITIPDPLQSSANTRNQSPNLLMKSVTATSSVDRTPVRAGYANGDTLTVTEPYTSTKPSIPTFTAFNTNLVLPGQFNSRLGLGSLPQVSQLHDGTPARIVRT